MRSEVNSGECVTFRSRNEYARVQRVGYEVKGYDGIKGHKCPRIDLCPHTYVLIVTKSMTSHSQVNFKSF